jgi:site-specific recombinase XerD
MKTHPISLSFSSLVQDFFSQYLLAQRGVSLRTIASYRDTFRIFLRYAESRTHKPPTALALNDLDVPLILDFLDHLEKNRKNAVRSRNTRLAALRSFLRYAALRDPVSLSQIERVLAIPLKRFDQPQVKFLSRQEVEAILLAPDVSTWSGQRDRVMFSTFYNTGARVSEIAALRVEDLRLEGNGCLQIHGKGRKQRVVPLWKKTTAQLRGWLSQIEAHPHCPLFPNRQGKPLTRSGIQERLHLAVKRAAQHCPTLKNRSVSPHTLRHSTALHLLQSGVDLTVIALWLGHESLSTTHLYVEADLQMKERSLEKLEEPASGPFRYRVPDHLLAFLDRL